MQTRTSAITAKIVCCICVVLLIILVKFRIMYRFAFDLKRNFSEEEPRPNSERKRNLCNNDQRSAQQKEFNSRSDTIIIEHKMSEAQDLIECPDCKSFVPKEGEYYYCRACKEHLVTNTYQLANMDLQAMPVKLIFDEFYILESNQDQFKMLQEKLITSPTLNFLYTLVLEEETLIWLEEFIKRHTILTKLHIIWQCSTEPQFINRFLGGLKFGSNLTELAFSRLQITKETAKMFGEAINALTNLQTLEIRELVLDVDADELQHVNAALKSSRSICNLHIHDHLESWRLLNGVFEENKSIKTLQLISYRAPLGTLHDDIIRSIFNGLKVNTTLQTLHIERPPLDTSVVKILADCIGSNSSITSLNLNIHMGDYDIIQIADALKSNRTITELDLSRNNFTSVPEPIFKMTSLTELNLSDIDLTHLNPIFLHDMLRSNKNLSRLYIPICTNAGCRSLADGLKINNTIDRLYLTQRNVDKDTFSYLSSVLETHPSLTTLFLKDTDTKISIFGWLKEFIKKNTNLEMLFVIGQYESEYIGSGMLKWLEHNDTLTGFGVDLNDNNCVMLDADEEIKALFDVNYALRSLSMWDVSASKYCDRNIKYQSEMRANTAIIIHNIARDPFSLNAKLPIEIWINVFKHLRYPGIKSFEKLARNIFKKYK